MTSHHSSTGGLQRPWDLIQGRLPNCGSKPPHLALAHEQAAQAGHTARLLGVEQRAQPELTAVGFHKEPASSLLAKALIQNVQVRMKVGLTHNQGEIGLSIRINHSQSQAGQGLPHLLQGGMLVRQTHRLQRHPRRLEQSDRPLRIKPKVGPVGRLRRRQGRECLTEMVP